MTRELLELGETGSSQDGGVGRCVSLSHSTKTRITMNLKMKNNQNCQKIKLY